MKLTNFLISAPVVVAPSTVEDGGNSTQGPTTLETVTEEESAFIASHPGFTAGFESSADETPILTVRDALEEAFDPTLKHFTPRRINATEDRKVVDCWEWETEPKPRFKKPLCKQPAAKNRLTQKKKRATRQELAGGF